MEKTLQYQQFYNLYQFSNNSNLHQLHQICSFLFLCCRVLQSKRQNIYWLWPVCLSLCWPGLICVYGWKFWLKIWKNILPVSPQACLLGYLSLPSYPATSHLPELSVLSIKGWYQAISPVYNVGVKSRLDVQVAYTNNIFINFDTLLILSHN